MSMKKKLLVLLVPFLLVGLSSCVKYNGQGKPGKKSSEDAPTESSVPAPEGSSDAAPISCIDNSSAVPGSSTVIPDPEPSADELPKGTEVKVYLVFGEYGKYKGDFVNTKIPSMFLEHAMEFTAKVGDLLPNDDVTSSVDGSHFVCWVAYNNDGKLTEYLKVPGYQNKILYASFTGGNGGGSSGQHGGGGDIVPPTPGEYTPASTGTLPTFGYGFKFSDGSYMAAVKTNSFDGFDQYLINHRSFTAGQTFQLYDFENSAGWTVAIDPWSFGGDSDESTAWKAYIQHNSSNQTYKVLQDFNVESVYIKLKYGEDEIYFQLGN